MTSAARREAVAYRAVAVVLALLVSVPWLVSRILPLMDYPMFLTFVRAVQDLHRPGAPMQGVYELGYPLSPLVVPLWLTTALAHLGTIESAGRVIWIAYGLGSLAAGAQLGRELGRSPWVIVAFAPLVFGKWVSSGFFGFVTALPLVLGALALTVRAFERRSAARLATLSGVLVVLTLWHTLAAGAALLFVGLFWLCWRAPSQRARWLGASPVLAPGAVVASWLVATYGSAPAGGPRVATRWAPASEVLDVKVLLGKLLLVFPGSTNYGIGLVAVVTLGAVVTLATRRAGSHGSVGAAVDWRVPPLLATGALCLVAYGAVPADALGVEIVGPRFGWFALVFLALGWSVPAPGAARVAVVGAGCLFAIVYLADVTRRFRDFHEASIGASRLIDSIGEHETLIAPIADTETPLLGNKPLREVQQYASVRKGGLPTTSFAGYGVNYLHYARQNPKPELFAHNWRQGTRLLAFDWVLLRNASPADARRKDLAWAATDGAWSLYRVCGSARFPTCSAR